MKDIEYTVLPKRKHPRLKSFDYSSSGYYFVTVCVKDRKPLLSKVIVGRDAFIPPKIELSDIGKFVNKNIEKTD